MNKTKSTHTLIRNVLIFTFDRFNVRDKTSKKFKKNQK